MSERRSGDPQGEDAMLSHIDKVIELVGSSEVGIEDAVQQAVTKAALQKIS